MSNSIVFLYVLRTSLASTSLHHNFGLWRLRQSTTFPQALPLPGISTTSQFSAMYQKSRDFDFLWELIFPVHTLRAWKPYNQLWQPEPHPYSQFADCNAPRTRISQLHTIAWLQRTCHNGIHPVFRRNNTGSHADTSLSHPFPWPPRNQPDILRCSPADWNPKSYSTTGIRHHKQRISHRYSTFAAWSAIFWDTESILITHGRTHSKFNATQRRPVIRFHSACRGEFPHRALRSILRRTTFCKSQTSVSHDKRGKRTHCRRLDWFICGNGSKEIASQHRNDDTRNQHPP